MTKTKQTNKNRGQISTDDLPSQQLSDRIQQDLPTGLGRGKTDLFHIDDGLNYIETRLNPVKDLAIESRIEQQTPRLVLTLSLKGHSCFKTSKGSESLFSKGYATITRFNSSLGERRYKANKDVLQLRFSLCETWLKKYFSSQITTNIFKSGSIQTLSYKPISPQGMFATQQLINSDTSCISKKMFIHGQALSILASELTPLCTEPVKSSLKHNQKDMDIVKKSRDILECEFKNPPSVNELAKRAGTNEFRLKQLFHRFYNTTPYALLFEIRMKTAYQMLDSRHCHVNEVAYFVGYQHASNFSAAFMKYFGVSPKHIAKKQ